MKCTWVDCECEATKPQISTDKGQWANLCPEHDAEFKASLLDPKATLRCWVRASGGARALADKTMASMKEDGSLDRLTNFMSKLQKRAQA